jgi:antitoxin (DNA-binding transcriptional repressor) of toxin-antitoxin stability system
MKLLKTVGIKELKNSLSAYLREVRGGATVLITDRNDIVAELHEPYSRTNVADSSINPLLLEWAEAGVVTLPRIKKEPLQHSSIHSPAGTAKDLLDSDRKEPGD